MATMYRLPRNAICAPCHEGAIKAIGGRTPYELWNGHTPSIHARAARSC